VPCRGPFFLTHGVLKPRVKGPKGAAPGVWPKVDSKPKRLALFPLGATQKGRIHRPSKWPPSDGDETEPKASREEKPPSDSTTSFHAASAWGLLSHQRHGQDIVSSPEKTLAALKCETGFCRGKKLWAPSMQTRPNVLKVLKVLKVHRPDSRGLERPQSERGPSRVESISDKGAPAKPPCTAKLADGTAATKTTRSQRTETDPERV